MTNNREKFSGLDSELIEILDEYDAKVASGELWIENGHAVNTDNPGQVWLKHASGKIPWTL